MDHVEYYDIMIIGHTGQGKSTTSDKLLIANQESVQRTTGVSITTNEAKKQLQCGDMTLWMTTTSEKFEEEKIRLRNLEAARVDENPHIKIQEIRESISARKINNDDNPGTKHCEVFSNEVSKVRVLDVPGFFDEGCMTGGPDMTIESVGSMVSENNLETMRKVWMITTVMNMKFKRILYFLPVRGPLERATGVLQLELKVLAHYFGSSIIKKIAVVATNPEAFSMVPEEIAFSETAREKTMKFVYKSLNKLFPGKQFLPIPLIYFSYGETCESILGKVYQAKVDPEDLQLKIDENTCIQCGNKVGTVKGAKIVIYNEEDKVLYDKSKCHPKMIPDIRFKHKLADFFLKLITFGLVSFKDQYLFDEICAKCGISPGATRGCMQVGSKYAHDEEIIIVDHHVKCT